MKYLQLSIPELGATAEISHFVPGNGTEEWHAILHIEPRMEMFAGQYSRIHQAEEHVMQLAELKGAQPVFKRYFLSDSTNQQPVIQQEQHAQCTVSYIQQPPLDGSKVALWIYLQRGTDIRYTTDDTGSTVVSHNGYSHIWTMGLADSDGDSHRQTETLLARYGQILSG
ncbi:MAG: hypothetical protein K2J00_06175, partial [Bacteroidaceae bacterium]|nr:hypothetical protein [Bacteroidaceae bacterium]